MKDAFDELMETLNETEDQPDVATESATETAEAVVDPDDTLTVGMESAALLDVLRETSTKEEYAAFIKDNITELRIYGLVDTNAVAKESLEGDEDDESLEAATEARNIVRLNRDANIAREEARIAIGLAKKEKNSLFAYYKKYSELKRKFRDKIYEKYGGRAKPLARKAVMNSRNKAAGMNSKVGTTIINKIDQRIKELDDAGRNKTAVKK